MLRYKRLICLYVGTICFPFFLYGKCCEQHILFCVSDDGKITKTNEKYLPKGVYINGNMTCKFRPENAEYFIQHCINQGYQGGYLAEKEKSKKLFLFERPKAKILNTLISNFSIPNAETNKGLVFYNPKKVTISFEQDKPTLVAYNKGTYACEKPSDQEEVKAKNEKKKFNEIETQKITKLRLNGIEYEIANVFVCIHKQENKEDQKLDMIILKADKDTFHVIGDEKGELIAIMKAES